MFHRETSISENMADLICVFAVVITCLAFPFFTISGAKFSIQDFSTLCPHDQTFNLTTCRLMDIRLEQIPVQMKYDFSSQMYRIHLVLEIPNCSGTPSWSLGTWVHDDPLSGSAPVICKHRVLGALDNLLQSFDYITQESDFTALIQSKTQSPDQSSSMKSIDSSDSSSENEKLYPRYLADSNIPGPVSPSSADLSTPDTVDPGTVAPDTVAPGTVAPGNTIYGLKFTSLEQELRSRILKYRYNIFHCWKNTEDPTHILPPLSRTRKVWYRMKEYLRFIRLL